MTGQVPDNIKELLDQAPNMPMHFNNDDGAPMVITEATLKAVRDESPRAHVAGQTGSDYYFIRPGIRLLNRSSKVVTGFALYLVNGESKHKVYFGRARLRIEPQTSFDFADYQERMMMPGNPEAFTVKVLQVGFEDGTEWGTSRIPTPSAAEAFPSSQSNVMTQALAIHKVQPTYPDGAKKRKVSGSVVVEVRIDEKGKVSSADRVSGDPELENAALEAARQWKFTPATLHGRPIQVIQRITFQFSLSGH